MRVFFVILILSCFFQNWIKAQEFLDSNRNDFDLNQKISRTLAEIEPDLDNLKAQDFLHLNRKALDPNKKISRSLVEVEPDLENLKATIRYDAFTSIQVRILYDKKKKMIAYKDTKNNTCLLEKISGSKKPLIYKLPRKRGEESQEKENDKVPKMFFLSNVALKRKKVRKFAGKRIMTFCDGLKTRFLKEMPFGHNELPESEERRNARKKLREQFFEFLQRNPRKKNNREKRQIRNRFRGQTQTQFLSFGEGGKGNAEAVAQPEISKTIVSGVNGIGQAQSQSGGADCDGCYPGEGGSRFDTGFRTGIGRETGRPESETAGAGRPGISDSRRGSDGTLPGGGAGTPGFRGGAGDGRDAAGRGNGASGIPGGRGEAGGPGSRTGGGLPGGPGGSGALPGTPGGPTNGAGGTGYPGTVGRGDMGGPGGAGFPGTSRGHGDAGRPGVGQNGHGYPGTSGGRGDMGGPGGVGSGYPGTSGTRPGIGTGGPGTGARDPSGRPIEGSPGSKTDGRGDSSFPGQTHGRPGELPATNGHVPGRYPPSASSKPYYPNGGHGQPGEGIGTPGGTGGRYPPSASSKPFYPGGQAPGHGQVTPGGTGTHQGGVGVQYPPSASSKPFYPGGQAPGHGQVTPGGTGTHQGGVGMQYPPSASSKPFYPGAQTPGPGSGVPGGAGTHPGSTGARYPPSASSKHYPNGQIQPGTPGARYPPSASSKPYYPPSSGSKPTNGRPIGPGLISPGATNGHVPGRYPPSASSKPYYPPTNGQQPSYPGVQRPGGGYPPSASSKPFYPPGTGGQVPPRYPPSASSKPLGPKNGHLPSSGNGLQPPARYPPSSSSKLYPPPGSGYVPGKNGHSGGVNGHGQVKPYVPPSAGSKPLQPGQGHWDGRGPDQRQFQPGRYPPSASSKPYYPPSSHSQPRPQFQAQPPPQQSRPTYPDGPGQIRPNIIFGEHGGPGQIGTDQYGGQEVPCESELPDGGGGIGGYPSPGQHGGGGHVPGAGLGKPGGNGYGQYPGSGTHEGSHPSAHSGSTYPGGHQGPSGSSHPTSHQGPSVPGEHHGAIYPGGHPGPSGSGHSGAGYPGTYPSPSGSGQPGGHVGTTYPGGHQVPSGSGGIYPPRHPDTSMAGQPGFQTGHPSGHHGVSGSGYPDTHQGAGQPGRYPDGTYPGSHQGPDGTGYPGTHSGGHLTPGLGHGGTGHPTVYPGVGGAGQTGAGPSGYPDHSGRPGTGHPGQAGAGSPGADGTSQHGLGRPGYYPGGSPGGQAGQIPGSQTLTPGSGTRPDGTQPGTSGTRPGAGDQTSGQRPGWGEGGPGYPGAGGSQSGGGAGTQTGGYPGAGTQTGGYPGAGTQTGGYPGAGTQTGGYPGAGTQTGGYPGAGTQTGGYPGAGTQTGGYPGAGTQTGGLPGAGPQTGGGTGTQTGDGGTEIGKPETSTCAPGTDCKSAEDSQVQTSVTQDGNATRALSSAQGRFGAGVAQAQVSGVYTGSGSFSAQAQTSDNDKGAQVQVIGGSRGASSSAQGMGGRGQTQAQVQLGSQNGATSAEAQSGGHNFGTNTQVQAGAQGGLADAQADGPGGTSSQAQIGFTPYNNKTDKEKEQKVPFQGGVSASAQSGANVGQSQTELFGSFYKGISYTGSAQAGSGRGINKLKNRNTTSNGTENEKESMTQIGFINKNGLPPLPKFGQGILKDFNVHEPVDQELVSKKANQSGEVPDLVKEKPDREELEPVTTAPVSKTGGNYAKDKPKPNPRIDKDAEILETNKDNEEEDDDEYEEEEYDELEDLKKAKPIKYKQGEGIETKYGSVIEKDQTITVKQKNPTQAQTVFIGGLDKKHDVHIEQDADEQVKEGDILQPGDTILGKDGFTIPEGYRGKVTSVAGQIGKTRAQAPDGGRAQSQTVLVKPGTGRIHYTNPRPYRGDQLRYAPHLGKYISNMDDPANKYSNGFDSTFTPPYASSSIINNGQKKYSNTYQSKSSGCGYYTFSCDVVFGSNGRAKICKPNPPTNPDGTPCII